MPNFLLYKYSNACDRHININKKAPVLIKLDYLLFFCQRNLLFQLFVGVIIYGLLQLTCTIVSSLDILNLLYNKLRHTDNANVVPPMLTTNCLCSLFADV